MSCFCFGTKEKGKKNVWEEFSDSSSDSNTEIYDNMDHIFPTIEEFHVPYMSPCILNAKKVKKYVKEIRGVAVVDVDLDARTVKVGGENFSRDDVLACITSKIKKSKGQSAAGSGGGGGGGESSRPPRPRPEILEEGYYDKYYLSHGHCHHQHQA